MKTPSHSTSATEKHVDPLHPPQARYLPKVVEAGDFIEIPISTSDLADTISGRSGRPRRGISAFWVEEADGTLTRVEVEPLVLQGLLQWLPEPRPAPGHPADRLRRLAGHRVREASPPLIGPGGWWRKPWTPTNWNVKSRS